MKNLLVLFVLLPILSVSQESDLFGLPYQGIVLDEVQYEYFSKGLKYLDEGSYEESVVFFNKLNDAGVANDYVNLLRAEIYYSLKDFKKVVYITSSILNDPDLDLKSTIDGIYRYRDTSGRISTTNLLGGPPLYKSDFLLMRGYAKYALDDFLGAKNDSEKYMAIWSNKDENFLLRGLIEYEFHNYEISMSFLKKAIVSNGSSSDVLLAEAYYYIGHCYLNLGNKIDALKNFSKAGEYGKSNAYDLIKKINSNM